MVQEKCSAENPVTCRYHGAASVYAPINDASVAQRILDEANRASMNASGKNDYSKAEKACDAARRQLMSVPSVQELNKAEAENLWVATSLEMKNRYRAYLRWNTGVIERENLEAVHRAAIFSTKSLYGELKIQDLKKLAPHTSSVVVKDNKLFLDGKDHPYLGVEDGKAVTYSDANSTPVVAYGDVALEAANNVTMRKAIQTRNRQEKRMLEHLGKLTKHLGGKIKSNPESSSGKVTHTVYTSSGSAIAQYITENGQFKTGTVAIDGRLGTSREAKLNDIEYRLLDTLEGNSVGQHTLPSYLTDEPEEPSYRDFRRYLG